MNNKARKEFAELISWRRAAEIFNQSGSDRSAEDVKIELRKIRKQIN